MGDAVVRNKYVWIFGVVAPRPSRRRAFIFGPQDGMRRSSAGVFDAKRREAFALESHETAHNLRVTRERETYAPVRETRHELTNGIPFHLSLSLSHPRAVC